MRTIAVLNQKGGVGKTTLVINLGAALAGRKKKILAVDLDPQAHLTYSLGVAAHEQEQTVFKVLRGEADAADAVISLDKMDILPASLDLSAAELEFASLPGREMLLKEALENLGGYDYVFLDCPPNLGLLTINALTAAGEVLIPVQTEFLPLQSLSMLMETVKVVQKRLNKGLKVSGIVGTRFGRRKRLHREVAQMIRDHFGGLMFKAAIRDNVALAEAPSFGQDIFSYKPRSIGAEDFKEFCEEFLRRK